MNGPLKGIRVADFTWIGAGSFTTKILADFGADVIKIESTEHIDSLRNSKPFQGGIPGVNRSGYFADRNSSKRSITLNMKHEQGRELARRLIARSDVVANNFTPGTMEKFGLGYDDICVFKPDIVYIAMSMQGQAGPEATYLGYGLTMGAVTGLQYLCGLPELDPVGTGTNYPDHVPNPTHGAFAILAALRHRRRSGQGQMIDLAQIEPAVAVLGPAVLDYTVNSHISQRSGNQHISASPAGVYPCKGDDRWIAIVAPDNNSWRALARVLHAPEMADDPRFATVVARWENRQTLDADLAALTLNYDARKLMSELQATGVAAGIMNDASDVLRIDPQLAYRGHWTWLDHPEMGTTVYNMPPFRMSQTPGGPRRPAPLLGQHTNEICRSELGLSEHEIAALRELGALS